VNGTGTELDVATSMTPPADPWSVVISWLKKCAADESHIVDRPRQPVHRIPRDGVSPARRSIAAERARTQPAIAKSAIVTFVERFTPKSVSITWRDATAANYSEQLWIRRIARSHGVCALTGATIVRGDAVYSPAGRTAAPPANCAQMVLASVLEDLE
jgi:hypothetical protein